jgi:hypothetical protein
MTTPQQPPTAPAGTGVHRPTVDRCAGLHARHQNATAPIGSKCQTTCRPPSPSQAHCTVCHRTFGGIRYFDAHRCNGWCLDPTNLGLVDENGLWTTPEGHERRAADTARLAAARAQGTT